MLVKSAAASLLLALSSPVAPAITYDDQRTNLQYPLTHQVICSGGRGSAFRVGPSRFLSAAHVTALKGCTIDGYLVNVVEQDGKNDFSVIEAGPPRKNWYKIDCGGYRKSGWYHSNGYALGLPYQTTVALFSTAFDNETGMHVFIGRHMVIPGMSGGPVMNQAGEVVGVVNAYSPMFGLSFSRALKDTSVCK